MADENNSLVELSGIEKSAIGEVCDLMTASIAKALGEILGSAVGVSPSEVGVINLEEIGNSVNTPVLLVQLSCTSALEGQFFMFVGGDGLPQVFSMVISEGAEESDVDDEEILENLKEVVNGAISGAMASFADSMGHKIDCVTTDIMTLQDETDFNHISYLYPEGNLLHVVAPLGLPESAVNVGYLLPISLGNQIIELLLEDQPSMDIETPGVIHSADVSISDSKMLDNGKMELAERGLEHDVREEKPQPLDLLKASFGSLDAGEPEGVASNISLLLDVMLDASIELGKTQMTIDDVLRLSRGSVIELDKLASEPVDFLVNGKVIARGEVVVIDDNFGIRITEILSPKARLESV